jgi:Leucine-rich repeat (LRR) protein
VDFIETLKLAYAHPADLSGAPLDSEIKGSLGDSVQRTMTIQAHNDLPDVLPASLVDLTITGHGLLRVIPRALKLANLTSLSLSGNRIADVPDTLFVSLPLLTHLDLSSNAFSSFPLALCNSSSPLRSLNLSHNQIAVLPRAITRASALESLDLSFNLLAYVKTFYRFHSHFPRVSLLF